MKRRDFEKLVLDFISDLPIEKQEETLFIMQVSWIKDIRKKFEEKVNKTHQKCKFCGKYFPKLDYGFTSKIVVKTDQVYNKENDECESTTERKYLINFDVCPNCHELNEKNTIQISGKEEEIG